MAQDESLPLLERLKFIAIFSSNTDEFFMVRVGTIHSRMRLELSTNRPDGVPFPALMGEIRAQVIEMMQTQRELMRELLHRLEDHGIRVADFTSLTPTEQSASTGTLPTTSTRY
ncbi:MAG: hypothetical protein IPK19_39885 [Chloroflexi bacterium]|nr:hypothetical protein [Chloroflexota bacterium]